MLLGAAYRDFVELWEDLWGGRFRLTGCEPGICWRVPVYPDEPLMSPHLLRPRELAPRGLARFAGALGERFGPRALYLSVLGAARAPRAPLDRRLRPLGWRLRDDSSVNAFTRPRLPLIPPGYAVELGDFGEPRLFAGYAALTRRCFADGERFVGLNARLIRELSLPVRTALIRARSGSPAAVGCIWYGRRRALFFGGAVLPGHRRRGLWRCLVALRQADARGRGIGRCNVFTANPRIRGSADAAYRVLTYERRPEAP